MIVLCDKIYIMETWEKRSEKILYQGWRKLIQKTFLMPDQTEGVFDIIGNEDFVTVAAFTPDFEAILVKQFRCGPEKYLTSFSEGYIDEGETPEETARRELLEETGYEAGKILFQKKILRAYNTEQRYCMLALDCKKVTEQSLDEKEFVEVHLMPLEKFRTYIKEESDETFHNVDSAYLALDYLDKLV